MTGRSALPSTDTDTAWLEDLIAVMEAVGSSAAPCDPTLGKAFSYRLGLPALAMAPVTLHSRYCIH